MQLPTIRGRSTPLNPGNRFESDETVAEFDDFERDGHPLLEPGRKLKTAVLKDHSRTIINHVDPAKSPDIPYRWSLNPYRGCEHGCIYCYARPSHEMLGMSCGLDFETKILAKLDAAALLRNELNKPGWRGEPIHIAGVTDPYQPLERRLRITRQCLEVIADARQPVSLVTKNRLIERDLDLLTELARHGAVSVAISLTTLDKGLAQVMEPRTSVPADRLRAIRRLADARVPVGVMTAPIIPGLTDREVPALLEAARDAGATWAGWVLLRLPWQIKDLFLDWLARHYPERASHVEALIRDTRGGRLYDARPGVRKRGLGPVARQVEQVVKVFRHRLGLASSGPALTSEAFRRPAAAGGGGGGGGGQMELFG